MLGMLFGLMALWALRNRRQTENASQDLHNRENPEMSPVPATMASFDSPLCSFFPAIRTVLSDSYIGHHRFHCQIDKQRVYALEEPTCHPSCRVFRSHSESARKIIPHPVGV